MQQIALYLQKFKNLGMEAILAKETVVALLRNRFGIQITKEQVEVKKGVVYITAHPVVKNEIFLHKNQLIGLLEVEIGKSKVSAVR